MSWNLRIAAGLATLSLTILGVFPSAPPARAQDEPGLASDDPAVAQPRLTLADRVIRLEKVIEADKARLTEVRESLSAREDFFDTLNRQIEEVETELAEAKQRLEDLGGPGASDEAAALAAKIAKGEEWIPIAKSQSDITMKSGKTLQEQIQSLERKIAEEERALARLAGPSSEELASSGGSGVEQAEAETPEGEGSRLGQVLPPGTAAGSTSAPAKEEAADTQPQTTEQIEARREAEKASQEAREAEEAVLSFVERKEALENQIEMEQQLLQTVRTSRDNLRIALQKAESDLETLISSEASRADLQRARKTLETVQALQQETQTEIDSRREYVDSLHQQLADLHEEQLAVTQEAQEKRQEAEAARKKTQWLESPLYPPNLWRWARARVPRMLLVIAVAWVLLLLVRWSARGVAKTVVGTGKGDRTRGGKRADTLALSFRSAISLFIVVAAVLLVFQEAGVDIKTVLGGAAILGVALAFGAQNLMRDYFTGFMILLEDQYELGDLITVGDITGTVEKVNMRTTVLRDIEGRVHFIPNGEIKSVTNRTYVWGRAVLEIPIDFKEDIDRVMEVVLDEARQFSSDPQTGEWVTDDPVMLGVDKFTESGMIIKFMIQTQPDKIFATRRELLRRIKNRFDKEEIEISVPHRMLMQEKSEGSGS
jgi:small-conductance mechanosensitive channel/predicted  nucleic acid-binding Zn-ribbon protein